MSKNWNLLFLLMVVLILMVSGCTPVAPNQAVVEPTTEVTPEGMRPTPTEVISTVKEVMSWITTVPPLPEPSPIAKYESIDKTYLYLVRNLTELVVLEVQKDGILVELASTNQGLIIRDILPITENRIIIATQHIPRDYKGTRVSSIFSITFDLETGDVRSIKDASPDLSGYLITEIIPLTWDQTAQGAQVHFAALTAQYGLFYLYEDGDENLQVFAELKFGGLSALPHMAYHRVNDTQGYLLVGDDSGLYVTTTLVDLKNGTFHFQHQGLQATKGTVTAIATDDSRLFYGEGTINNTDNKLHIATLSDDGTSITHIAAVDMPFGGKIGSIVVDDNLAYVASGGHGVQIVDLSANPPRNIGAIDKLLSFARSVAATEHFVIVEYLSQVIVWDKTTHEKMSEINILVRQ